MHRGGHRRAHRGNVVPAQLVRRYGHAYGAFGISLALAAFVGIIASFWVWIAAVMSVWWERKAGPAAVAAMEELSADLSAS